MPIDAKKMFSQDPASLSDTDIVAANTLYMAEKTNRPPDTINYDAEKEVFFGEGTDDNSAFISSQNATTGGFLSEWGKEIVNVVKGDFEPNYTGTFWNDLGQALPSGVEVGSAKAKSTLMSMVDVIPSWGRGLIQLGQQGAEAAGVADEQESMVQDIMSNQFIATMLSTPLQFIEESGEINKESKETLRALMEERGGKTGVVVSELGTAVEETVAFLGAMRLGGVQIGMTPKQAANGDVGRQMISRLESAGKLGVFKGIFSEAESLQERADIVSITSMYMATPAASGVFSKGKDVFIADLLLNSAITAPQTKDIWAREDLDDFDKILETVKSVGSDIVFSSMTKTMRGNRLAPDWKPMEEASRKLVKRYKADADIKELIAETDRLAEVNKPFADPNNIPKPGSALNRIQGESDVAEKNGNGFIKIEQEKANAEKDIESLEEALRPPEKPSEPQGAKGDAVPVEAEKGSPADAEGALRGLDDASKQTILDTINETRNLPVDERVDAINRSVQDAIDGKERAKTSKVKQRTEKTTGVRKPKKMIVIDEYQALKRRLREINRTIKEGKKLGKAEEKAAQAERKANLADLHGRAKEYVNEVVRDKDARNALKVKIPSIKTIEGLDKFQSEVNKALAEQARKTAQKEAKDAIKGLRKTKLGTELRPVAKELLADIDTKGTSDKKLKGLREARELLEKNGIEILPETAEKMEVLEKLRLKDMTTADLVELKNVAKSIVHMQKQKEALTKQGQERIVEQKATEYVDEQRPDRVADSGLIDEKGNRIDPKSGGVLAIKRTLDLTPNALLFYLDGGREGAAHDLYVKNIWKGDDQRLRLEQEAHRYMEPFSDLIKGWDKATAKEGFRTTLGGKEVVISRAEKIAIYLDSLNEGNTRHVREGGYVINDKVFKPTEQELDKILDSVRDDATELQVASAIYNGYQNILRPAINETSNKVNGYDIANVDNYHPISTVRTAVGEKEATPSSMREYTKTLVDSSPHFKKRIGGSQPIRLQDAISKYDQMVKLVSRYNGYAEPIALQKAFLDGKSADGTSVRDTITKAYGKTYVKALEKLTEDLEAGGNRDISAEMRVFNKGIMHVGRGYLALNVSVAAGQPVSYMTAGNIIPIKHWNAGNKSFRMIPWEVMAEHSSLLWSRGKGHLDIAFGESAEAKKLSKNMAMIRGMDHLAISKIWTAAESWVKDDKGFVDAKEVAKRVDDVVRRTQPTFETIDRPQLARNPNFRFASMFSSVINKNHALKFMNDVDAYEKIKRNEWTPEAKADWARKTLLNRALTPAIYAAIKTATNMGFLTDLFAEDENSFLLRWANKMADATIGEMGLIASKLGQTIKFIASKKSEYIKGSEQNMPGSRELEDIGSGLMGVAEIMFRADEDLMDWKTESELQKESEKDKKTIERLIRGSLSLSGRGYQNVYDWGKLGKEIAQKEEDDGWE